MTSVLIIGLSSLLFWLTPSKTSNFNGKKNGNIVNYEQFDKDSDNVVEKTNELAVKFPQKKPNSVTSEDTNLMERKSHKLKMEPVKNEPFIVNDSKNNETTTKLCEWPIDTTIDKHSLFIYLSNDELLNLGVYLYADSMYYCNEGLIQVFMLVSSQA